MTKGSSIEKLAVPMFISGIIAMVASAFISLGATASATSPVQYKKISLTYLSNGYSANDSGCGSAQDYYGSRNFPSFRAKYSSSTNSSNGKTFLCTSIFYVVDDVQIPTPKPVPTITVIYRPTPTNSPSQWPTSMPRPTSTPTRTSRPIPSFTPFFTPIPRPTFPIRPTLPPTRAPRP